MNGGHLKNYQNTMKQNYYINNVMCDEGYLLSMNQEKSINTVQVQ